MDSIQTILIVDDDQDDILLLHQSFKEVAGQYLLAEAKDGRAGLDWLQAAENAGNLPCLIILDINMPIMDGREMLSHIKQDKNLRNIPVVVFSTSSNPEDFKYCKMHGVEMITKPFNITLLNDIVNKMLLHCKDNSSVLSK